MTPRNRLANQSGSVLATALLVLIILLTIFVSAMTYALARYGQHTGTRNTLVARHLAEAGVSHWLARIHAGEVVDSLLVETDNGGRITVTHRAWGPCLLVESNGKYGSAHVAARALVGSRPSGLFHAAVVTCDETVPLVVSGHTQVVGDIITGPQGVMGGRFRGESPPENFHQGQQLPMQALDVPAVDARVLSLWHSEIEKRRQAIERTFPGSLEVRAEDDPFGASDVIRIENNLVLHDAVLTTPGRPRYIFVDGWVDIRGTARVSGFTAILSGRSIHVSDSAVIDRSLLSTRDSIVIDGDAHFAGVALTPGALVVRGSVTTTYPAMLLAEASPREDTTAAGISLESTKLLEGAFVLLADSGTSRRNRWIYVDTTTLCQGVILSEDQVDLRGYVYGSVVTELFHYDYPPSTYINWLRSACVRRDKLDYPPCLPVLQTADSIPDLRIIGVDFTS